MAQGRRDSSGAPAGGVWGRLARPASPLIATILLLFAYRVVVEPVLFHTSFSRARFPSDLPGRGVSAIAGGLRVAVLDHLRLSARALRDLVLLTPGPAVITVLGILVMAAAMFAVARRHQARLTRSTWAVAFSLFVVAHLIYVSSDYGPTSSGFESRTQGGVRFASSFLVAVTVLLPLGRRLCGWMLPPVLAAAFALCALGMVGQREGWIAAARYNDDVVDRIGEAMNVAGIDPFPFIFYRDGARGELIPIQSLRDWEKRGPKRGTVPGTARR